MNKICNKVKILKFIREHFNKFLVVNMILLNKFIYYLDATYIPYSFNRTALFFMPRFTVRVSNKVKNMWMNYSHDISFASGYDYVNKGKNKWELLSVRWDKYGLYLKNAFLNISCALYMDATISNIKCGDICIAVNLEKKSLREHFNELGDKDIMPRNFIQNFIKIE